MKQHFLSAPLLILGLFSFASHGATSHTVDRPHSLSQVLTHIKSNAQTAHSVSASGFSMSSDHADDIHFEQHDTPTPKHRHRRYNQFYKQFKVTGAQMIKHQDGQHTRYTGSLVGGLAQDLPSTVPVLSEKEAMEIAHTHLPLGSTSQTVHSGLEVYVDQENNTAYLAYHITQKGIRDDMWFNLQTYIDAKTGRVLNSWDDTPQYKYHAQSRGGTDWPAHYGTPMQRKNEYRFVNTPSESFQYGPLETNRKGSICYLETGLNDRSFALKSQGISTYDLMDYSLEELEKYDLSPELTSATFNTMLPVLTMCDSQPFDTISLMGSEPHTLYSQNADAHYFAVETQRMLKEVYHVTPFRTRVHVMTHLELDNAFAIGSMPDYDIPEQIWIGNGKSGRTVKIAGLATPEIIAHELGHLITANTSSLRYRGQSGAINESFSDMTAIAFEDHLNQKYPWSTYTYEIGGLSVTVPPYFIRSMDDPEVSGSISHSGDFEISMNVHYSSGVFNRAFYNLIAQFQWDVEKAYHVMLYANMHYWTETSNFNSAMCGILNAADDLNFNSAQETMKLVNAFSSQGVTCDQVD